MEENRHKNSAIDHRKWVVFFDFDNTITTLDVFDDMVTRFSKDERWISLEKKWREGKIGSKECLEGQLKGIRITKKALDKYLSGIKLDPYFKRLAGFLKARKIKSIVLSDNFDYILKRILNRHSVKGMAIYSNKLLFDKERLIPSFPFRSGNCELCGHCKTKNLLANVNKDSIIVYIGDGHSDVCPAKYADIVFAKQDLKRYYKNKGLRCVSYNNLKEVYDYLKKCFYHCPLILYYGKRNRFGVRTL